MTPKVFWSTLGALIFVVSVIVNFTYGIPEPVLVILIGLWSLCFAATIKVDNPVRKKHWKSLESIPEKGQVYATKRRPEIKPAPKPKFQWPDGFSDWKEADRDWYVRQMELAGWEFDEGDKTPKHVDIGENYPHDEVGSTTRRFKCSDCQQMKLEREGFEIHHQMNLRCQACIDKRRRQEACKHSDYDQLEITSLSDDQQVMLCKKCGKQLGGVMRAKPKES